MEMLLDTKFKVTIELMSESLHKLVEAFQDSLTWMPSPIPDPNPAFNRERVQMWYDALVSGEYRQIFSTLTDYSNGFCALGVAWQVYTRETGHNIDPTSVGSVYRTMSEWYGYGSDDPQVTFDIIGKGSTRTGVTVLNDVYQWTFPQIAEAIRQTFLADELEVPVPDSPAELMHQELIAA